MSVATLEAPAVGVDGFTRLRDNLARAIYEAGQAQNPTPFPIPYEHDVDAQREHRGAAEFVLNSDPIAELVRTAAAETLERVAEEWRGSGPTVAVHDLVKWLGIEAEHLRSGVCEACAGHGRDLL